jgi:hypothetical protein
MNTPAGAEMMWPLAVAPAGWLIEDGKTIGPTGSGADYEGDIYQTLYDTIQNLFGGTYNWAGGGKVNLPDSRGKFLIAASASLALRSEGGSATIAEANLPVHDHPLTMDAVPAHPHGLTIDAGGPTVYDPTSGTLATERVGSTNSTGHPTAGGSHPHTGTVAAGGGHTPTGTVGNAGSGAAYYPPYAARNIIMKY